MLLQHHLGAGLWPAPGQAPQLLQAAEHILTLIIAASGCDGAHKAGEGGQVICEIQVLHVGVIIIVPVCHKGTPYLQRKAFMAFMQKPPVAHLRSIWSMQSGTTPSNVAVGGGIPHLM